MSSHPPPTSSGVPHGRNTGLDSQGLFHIDTQPQASASGSNQNADVAGVLRRNQACLQCRKRKLARPNCATCVRSYRHSLRTAPKSNPVLCCDYDDGIAGHAEEGEATHLSESPAGPTGSAGPEDEDPSGTKKKRKATGEGKRKKKDEDFEEERDRLTKQIEQLQAQLSRNAVPQQQWVSNSAEPASNKTWANPAQPFQNSTIAPSPTAFLEMLSSAASAHTGQTASAIPGPPDPGPLFGIRVASTRDSATTDPIDVDPPTQSQSRRTSSQQSPNEVSSGESSSGPNILSPNGIFNFSPGDTTQIYDWPPAVQSSGIIEPSSLLQGSWKGVETIDSVFAASMADLQDSSVNMSGNINMDGLQAGLDAAMQEQLLLDLFWPGWPNELPEPNIVTDLVEAFFDYVPNLPRVLHRPRFLARMALPPTHSNFPHPALIHALCAAAAAWGPSSIYERSKKAHPAAAADTSGIGLGMYGETHAFAANKNLLPFGLQQASYAKEAVTQGLNTGNRLFDVVKLTHKQIILSRVFIDDTRMLECWAYGGLVARMLLPLGLNVRSAELSLKSVMLPPPADALEREERRAAIWMAFYHDSIASAASGWGTSIALDELTVPLPVSAKDFDLGLPYIAPNPQDLESPDLWIKHPVVDSFVMVVKACLLLNRVNRFARKWKNRHLRDNDDYEGMSKPEFRELTNSIACFQMSFPPSLRNYHRLNAKGNFDIDLIAAHMLPYCAIICLWEPFADISDSSDPAAQRIVSAAQGITTIVQQLAGTTSRRGTNFTAEMHSSISVCLVTAARTLLVFIRNALNVGDEASAEMYRLDAETIRMALSQFGQRFKIGHHHAQLIEYFIDRCNNPTYEKLSAHYPEHPRPGGLELRPDSNMGLCVMHALNVKRGFWRLKPVPTSSGVSPLHSTPESMGSSSHGSGVTHTTADTSVNISSANGDKNSPISLSEEEVNRIRNARMPGVDGHLPLLFQGTEDEARKFYDRKTTAAGVDLANAKLPSPTEAPGADQAMVEILRVWHGSESNGTSAKSKADTSRDTSGTNSQWPNYGLDANGDYVPRSASGAVPSSDTNVDCGFFKTFPATIAEIPSTGQETGLEPEVAARFDSTRTVREDGHMGFFATTTEAEVSRFQQARAGRGP